MTYHSGAQMPLTSDKLSGFNRVKVDPAQTSFFEGREFRTFKEFNIPALTTYVIRINVPVDIILAGIDLNIDGGFLRMASVVGGTPGGTFSETLPVFSRNNMAVGPNKRYAPTPQVSFTAGGTHTGGTELDVVRVKVTTNQGNSSASSVGVNPGDERGIGINVYYFRCQNLHATDAVTGMFRGSWEERVTPPASAYA